VQRSQGRAPGPGSRRRTRWWHVVGPLVVGLAFCALGLWAGRVYRSDQASFRAQAVPATAVIDQVYAGALRLPGAGAPEVFNQYGIVQFQAHGRTAHARVLLVDSCTGACFPVYRVGQVLTVYYRPENPSYAQLAPAHETPAGIFYAVWIFGFLGLIFLMAAVINAVAAHRDARG
jgi:hypothetical protein